MKRRSWLTGGFFGSSYWQSYIDHSMGDKPFPAGATWPFAWVTLDDQKATVSILGRRVSVRYKEAKSVYISRLGYIVIVGPDEDNSFGFSVFRFRKVLAIMQAHGLETAKISTKHIVFARMAMAFVIVYALFVFWLIANDGI
jgi:hypothetical protein